MIRNIALSSEAHPGSIVRSIPRHFPPIRDSILLFGGTVVAIQLAFRFFVEGQVSALWPATGVVVAATLLSPKRLWPGVMAVFVLAYVPTFLSLGVPLSDTLVLAFVNLAEVWLFAWLFTRTLRGPPRLTTSREAIWFVLITALVAGTSGLAGGAVRSLYYATPFWVGWLSWWIGDGFGILLVAPAILVWALPAHRKALGMASPFRMVEMTVLTFLLLASANYAFGAAPGSLLSPAQFPYVTIPFLMWAAFRFGVVGASSGAVLISVVAGWNTMSGRGPFAAVDGLVGPDVLSLQVFLGVKTVFALMAATVTTELRNTKKDLGRSNIENIRTANARLKASEQQSRALLESAQDGIVVTDRQGVILLINAQTRAMFGYDAEELIGNPVELLVPATQQAAHRAQRVAYGAEPTMRPMGKDLDLRGRRKDGSEFPVEISLSPTRVGEDLMIMAVVRDVTERKALERQFHAAQRMDAVGQLAGGIAHDFNNILTIISGCSSLLQDQLPAGSPMQASVRAQSKASERGAALTRQLLAFGRKQRFDPKVLKLNDAISELHMVLRRTLGEDIDLITLLASKGYVEADPAQLEQVIVNLAVNARHAMPQGGKLEIRTSDVELDEARASELQEVSPGRYSLLTVSDSGTGMDPDTVVRIFEPFFTTKERGEGTGLGLAAVYGIVKQSKGAISVESKRIFEPFFTTKERGEGTGLGLAAVYGIVKQSKGAISVESKPGVGTVFDIFLPQVPSAVLDSREALSDEEVPFSEGRILLVEDDEDVRVLTAKILRARGYSVLDVTGAGQAKSAVEGGPPFDLVLTDVVMPKTSGPELVERLRTRDSDFKVLYMSGYSDNTSKAYRLVGGSELLDKPFTPADLLRKVHEVLRGS